MSTPTLIPTHTSDSNTLCYTYYEGQYWSCFPCLPHPLYLHLVDVKDKNVWLLHQLSEIVTKVDVGFTWTSFFMLWLKHRRSWKLIWVFFIQKWDRSMSCQEFVVVWKLPALTGEELDELFKIAWILLGILIVCCCFLLLLEVASGSSVCRYS